MSKGMDSKKQGKKKTTENDDGKARGEARQERDQGLFHQGKMIVFSTHAAG